MTSMDFPSMSFTKKKRQIGRKTLNHGCDFFFFYAYTYRHSCVEGSKMSASHKLILMKNLRIFMYERGLDWVILWIYTD